MGAPVIFPNSTCGTITGTAWRKVRAYTTLQNGEERVASIYKGPYSQLSTAYASLVNAITGALSISPSTPEGSALATITVITPVTSTQWTPKPHEVRQPQYDVIPVETENDLRCMFPQHSSDCADVDNAIRKGTCGKMNEVALSADGQKYRKWRMAGVRTYSRTTYNFRITRFFDNVVNLPSASMALEYAKVNSCYTWANVKTLGDAIPTYITEPVFLARIGAGVVEDVNLAFSSANLQWRLAFFGPQYQGKAISIVWEYRGVVRWSSDFYDGGSWVAPAVT